MTQEQWIELAGLVSIHGSEIISFETNDGQTLVFEDVAYIEQENTIAVLLD